MDEDRAGAIITSRLQPGERLIWYDRPNPWRLVLRQLFLLVFGIIFAASAFTQSASDYSGSLGSFPAASGLFFAFGLGIIGWSLRSAANCWRTAYGLTDRRAIIAVGDGGPIESFGSEAFYNIKCRGESHGSLEFDYRSDSEGQWAYMKGFHGIREPARVEAAIREHLLAPASRSKISGDRG